ncbi:MAG: D-2-hydroxyacid dehydrogenase [Acidobacteria bacterium]|nr:D-2-hydroxyacid dehydrogenase [Acidobacteriota bacterium]
MAALASGRIVVQLNAYSAYRMWSISESAPDRIARSFPEVRVVQSRDRETFVRLLAETSVLFTWSLPRPHFARASALKWVHTPEGGVDRFLYPELAKSEVLLTNSRGLTSEAVADHALALLLSLSRRLAECRDAQRARTWARDLMWSGDRVPHALTGRVMVVLGAGSIGSAVARRAKACGMTVLALRRRTDEPPPPGADEVHRLAEIDALLERADVLVLALPLTRDTRRILGAERLARVKPGALLVNIGRGELLDEAGLLQSLAAGRLGGAGLDVFDDEPLPRDNPLWNHPRVVVTPHVAGTDPGHMERATELFESNLGRFLRGEPLVNLVDKSAGY